MDRSELFNQALQVATRLLEQGAHDDALVVLQMLYVDEGYGGVRAIACIDCAQVHLDRSEIEHALVWYDRGIILEEPLHTCLAARRKAKLLADLGRGGEALALYQELLAGRLQAEDAEEIRAAVAALAAQG
jgi:hypothetical protein